METPELRENLAQAALTPRQQTLLEALREKDARLARMYQGAIWARVQPAHPDPLAHVAHGMRELMEKLPIYLDIPTPAKDSSLTVKVNELKEAWDRADARSKCKSTNGWQGEIDQTLKKFLRIASDFFGWYSASVPRRKERTASALRGLDPMGKSLPSPIQDLRVEEWHTLAEYFQAVSHHKETVDPIEFDSYMQQAEIFIVDRLRPRTFDDHTKLEALIRDAENATRA